MKKTILTVTGVAVLGAVLMSFVMNNDDEKKKKYQIIHQKDGEVMEFDTLLPMSSNYSVEDFLKDKGIDDENVEIIKIPSFDGHHMFFHDGDENVVLEGLDNMEFDFDMEGEMVKIIAEEGTDGELKVKKYVNGEEVEMTEEELEKLKTHKGKHHMGGHHGEGEHHGEHRVIIKMDSEESAEFEEAMKEIEVELKELDVDLDSMMKSINVTIEKIVAEEGEEGETHKVIIKMDGDMEEFDLDMEDFHKEMEELHIEMEKLHEEGEMMRMHKMHVDGDEDFTIVLVTENIDGDEEVQREIKKEIKMSEENMKLYPNPNDGTFTIEFDQSEKQQTVVEVVSADGKKVFKDKLGKFSGKYKKELDLKKHGSGTYIVKIIRGDDVTAHKVIIE